jgi:phage terminase large subunit GpA-like protein
MFDELGSDWLAEQVDAMPDHIERVTPVLFNEQNRYLPQGVSPRPGFIRYDLFPFLREVIECFDPHSPVREVNFMKGVQTGYTTLLESIMLYYIAHIKTQAMMFLTADKELAAGRMENNIIPMINESGFADLIRSADEGNSRKTGKALALDTLIPTPDGMRRIADVTVGDIVFAPDGSQTRVVTESPVHERDCYDVEFWNGEVITASEDHRWQVNTRYKKGAIETTSQLAASGVKVGKGYRYRVDVCRALQVGDVDLPVEPYTLGAWLGDGSSQDPYIAAGDYAAQILGQIGTDGYALKMYKTAPGKCPLFAFKSQSGDGMRKRLRRLGLIGNKHIPDTYLAAGTRQRLRLLQGIMDTDGSCTKAGECDIVQKNERLARGIWQLVNSLGVKATISARTARSQNKTESTVWRVRFYAPQSLKVFTIREKQSRLKQELSSRSYQNTLRRITPAGRQRVKCIGVAHPSELYVCGRGSIPTHNTKDFVQWDGGGFMIYNGAMNAAKMRQYSVPVMLKDELDGWKRSIGKDGNSDALTDARMSAYWAVRKILRGSTPLLEPSMINDAYLRGDQRKYMVLCKSCAFPQEIKQAHAPSTDTGVVGGFQWDTVEGVLQLDSVRYACANCGHEHYEHDKERLFSEEHGAHWQPTAKPKEPGIRSYHLPAFYSPYGFRPWSKCVADYLEAYDPINKQTKSVSKLQEYYNNTLGVPFRVQGSRIQFQSVSAHRRPCYMLGEIPNRYALDVSGSPVLMLVCVVDVHKDNLAVSVMGATRDSRVYVVDYWRFEVPPGEPECSDLSSPVWQRLRDLIEEKEYTADDGKSYRLALTLVDAGWSNDTVTSFCAEYTAGVYPILGRDRPGKNQTIREFSPFETQQGTTGYKIVVDHYKDRLSPVLRRDWTEDDGPQRPHHFNAPQNMTDKQLKELTVEVRREKVDAKGGSSFEWHRPGNARNELWDLLCYAHAAVEITAWSVCIKEFGLDTVDWSEFWRYIENEKIYFNDEVTT